MTPRSAILVLVALAVLVARSAGLHFHVADHPADHHDHDHVHAAPMAPLPESAITGLEDHHLLDHFAGVQDVEQSAIPPASGSSPALILFFVGLVLALSLLPARGLFGLWWQAPLRPPRPRLRIDFLPPPLGPPHAA